MAPCMRWCVTGPGPNTALHTTQPSVAMNITNDPKPMQMVRLDGCSTRSALTSSVSVDESKIAAIATQCLEATRMAAKISTNQIITNTGATERCEPESDTLPKTSIESMTRRAVRNGSRQRSCQSA